MACVVLHAQRSLRDIAEILKADPLLADVEAKRRALGVQGVTKKFIGAANIEGLLMDDGLSLDGMHELKWHMQFVPLVKRVLRIEAVAEQLLAQALTFSWRGRAGKGISAQGLGGGGGGGGGAVRLTDKRLLNYLLVLALEVCVQRDIPMQLHTGFGDKDLDLLTANPLLLKPLLDDARFQRAKLVLLHCSYPYMRQAGYLASVYPQVYIDYGLVFSKLSVRGMHIVARELLELTPINKIMYSGDGYGFAESYYVGAKWGRQILSHVLCEAYDDCDLTLPEALSAATCILRENAIKLYKLDLTNPPQAGSSGTSSIRPADVAAALELPGGRPAGASRGASLPEQECQREGVAPQPGGEAELPSSDFVRLLFVDASGQRRVRMVPTDRFESVVVQHGVGITQACMAMSSLSDAPSPGSGLSAVGEIRLVPDLSTRRNIPWWPKHEVVLADMHSVPGTPWDTCPRATLSRVCALLLHEFGLEARAAYESEFYLLHSDSLKPVDATPYCSSAALDAVAPFLAGCAAAAAGLGVTIEQMHAESGGGQFEIALTPGSAMEAADQVTYLREAVTAVARKHKYRATFLPQWRENDAASGAHMHVSLWKDGINVFAVTSPGKKHNGGVPMGEHFMAGVLQHLPAVMAFTAPIPMSYERLAPNKWTGAFQCWGRENREAALRTCCPPGADLTQVTNFEVKAVDACANPHLALAAVIAAGIAGLREHINLPPPVEVNPAELPDVRRLPASLQEATESLKQDHVLLEILGDKLCQCILAVRAVSTTLSSCPPAWRPLMSSRG
eukprot:jgi/Mesen1/8696/ME000052S08122